MQQSLGERIPRGVANVEGSQLQRTWEERECLVDVPRGTNGAIEKYY
jgi:hypothetical protein